MEEINSYSVLTETTMKQINNGNNLSEEEKDILLGKARVYNAMSKLNPNDRYVVFDSGMFNGILRGYVEISLKEAKESIKKKVNISDSDLEEIFYYIRQTSYYSTDFYSSKEAEDFYNGNS